MKTATPIILIRSLNVMRGGVTRASIKRANLLSEVYDEVLIVTFLYQQYHKQIIKDLYKKKILSKKVKVVNFFEDIKPSKKKIRSIRNKKQYLIKEKGLVEFAVKNLKKEPSYRYYKDGQYVKYKRFNEDGHLKFVDYMNSSRHRLRREEFDEQGHLVRIRHMDQIKNKPRIDQYFDNKGNCYLTVHVNPNTGREGFTVHFKSQSKQYNSLYGCQQNWMNTLLNNINHPVVFCELRGLDRMIRKVKHKNIKKIGVIHTSHLAKPYNNIERIKEGYIQLFQHANKFDWIVFLTNEQKQDAEFIYGKQKNFIVIPHSCKIGERVSDNKQISFNNNLAVTLARYHKDKMLDEAIRSFKYVTDEIPNAKYYIYGNGPMKKELQKLINELNLENNVFLKDYTLDTKQVYKSATCSILTSRQEGFGMVLTESMASGTPVVSFETKYGPKDIIRDGENGYLVSNRDKKQLANKITKIMLDEKIHKKLSKNALNICHTFSEKKYRKRWLDIVNK